MGSTSERGERGEERGARWQGGGREGGAPWGRAARGAGAAQPVAPLFGLHVVVREKKGGRRREEREKKRRMEGKTKEKMGKNFKHGNF
jgi:hypothetical protein